MQQETKDAIKMVSFIFLWVLILFFSIISLTNYTDDEGLVIEKINVDGRGLISVTYTQNGERWSSDYLDSATFHEKFGIIITNYK